MKQLKQMEEKLTLRNWSIDFSLENEYSKVYDEDGEREYPEISSTSIDAENIVALYISTLHFLKANYPNYSYSSNELSDQCICSLSDSLSLAMCQAQCPAFEWW